MRLALRLLRPATNYLERSSRVSSQSLSLREAQPCGRESAITRHCQAYCTKIHFQNSSDAICNMHAHARLPQTLLLASLVRCSRGELLPGELLPGELLPGELRGERLKLFTPLRLAAPGDPVADGCVLANGAQHILPAAGQDRTGGVGGGGRRARGCPGGLRWGCNSMAAQLRQQPAARGGGSSRPAPAPASLT